MPKVDKVIVTNVAALKAKYRAGYTRINAAVKELIAADRQRGLATRLVPLDSAVAMKRFKATPVTDVAACEQNKTAVDQIFRALVPDYLLILGSVDVIPHQDVQNPVYSPGNDDDRLALSDLPYACDAPYSQKPEDFRGPTRVVGRLPDVTGGDDPAYLTGLLSVAASHKTSPRDEYSRFFGITAAVWKKSTALSLRNTFGSSAGLQISPAKGPSWTSALLGRRMHFINCHGAQVDAFYYGQQGGNFPKAHAAAHLDGRAKAGTIVSAECCYGAELYDPNSAQGQAGICNVYLKSKAYGFFGASTIAYGPSEGNGSADLICQYFFQLILRGASLGRAVLEARQRFAQSATMLDPIDLKTLMQFNLMGDPAIHPVEPAQHALNRTKAFRAAISPQDVPAGRAFRRSRLVRSGLMIEQSVPAAKKKPGASMPRNVKHILTLAARDSALKTVAFSSFGVPEAGTLPRRIGRFRTASKAGPTLPVSVHLAIGSRSTPKINIRRIVVLAATVQGGEILRLRRLHSR